MVAAQEALLTMGAVEDACAPVRAAIIKHDHALAIMERDHLIARDLKCDEAAGRREFGAVGEQVPVRLPKLPIHDGARLVSSGWIIGHLAPIFELSISAAITIGSTTLKPPLGALSPELETAEERRDGEIKGRFWDQDADAAL
jgi:hypothetical protein